MFDKEQSGYITAGELKYGKSRILAPAYESVLTSLGDKLSEDEVDELLKVIHVGKDGRVDYHGINAAGCSTDVIELVKRILEE